MCISAGAALEWFYGFFTGAGLQTACTKWGQQNLTSLHLSVLPTAVLKSKPDCMDRAKEFALHFCARAGPWKVTAGAQQLRGKHACHVRALKAGVAFFSHFVCPR